MSYATDEFTRLMQVVQLHAVRGQRDSTSMLLSRALGYASGCHDALLHAGKYTAANEWADRKTWALKCSAEVRG